MNTLDIEALVKARDTLLTEPVSEDCFHYGWVWDNGVYYEFTDGKCTERTDYNL